jgi:hypothetical protein
MTLKTIWRIIMSNSSILKFIKYANLIIADRELGFTAYDLRDELL